MASEPNNHGTPKLKRQAYEEELQRRQAELCKLQDWVKHKGLRVIVIFEGRDAAGKGGTIGAHRTGEPPCLPRRGPTCILEQGEDPDICTALYAAFSSRW